MQDKINLIIDCNVLESYYKYYFSLHPRAKKVPIKNPYHESINQWMILKRPAMNCLKQKWKDFIVWFVDQSGYSNLNISECKMSHKIFYKTNRRHDVDNTVPKFILDGMVAGGLLVDDSSKNVTEISLSCGVDKLNPRTEITLEIYKYNDTERKVE